MLPQFNPIVLDVIVVVALLFLLVLGAFKGIKHVLINFALLAGSIALSFSPVTTVIKVYIIELLQGFIEFGAGASNELKLGVTVSYMFMASMILTLVLYILLRLFKSLIEMVIKRKQLKANKLPRMPRAPSRILGGLFSLILNGSLVLVLLSVFTNPLVGGNKTSDITYVTKEIDKLDDKVISLISDNELIDEHIILRLVRGDFFVATTDEDAKTFASVATLVNDKALMPSDLSNIQENLDGLRNLLSFVVTHGLDEDGLERDGFEKTVELTRNLVTNIVNQMNTLNESEDPINATGTLAISNLLNKLGLSDCVKIFQETFVIQ